MSGYLTNSLTGDLRVQQCGHKVISHRLFLKLQTGAWTVIATIKV